MDLAVGQILLTAMDFAPSGTLACNGQLVSLPAHAALFEALGTRYGGDGSSTFGLPDIAPIASAGGPPLAWAIVAEGPSWGHAMEALIGEVRLLPAPPPPAGGLALQWTPCDGRTQAIANNVVLFDLLGVQFGGDGTSTFALPALASAAVANGPALDYYICATNALFPPVGGNSVTPEPESYTYNMYLATVLQVAYAGPLTNTIESLALCQGQTLSVETWNAVAALLGQRFGGQRLSFDLPVLPTGGDQITRMLVMNGFFPPRS